MIVKHIAHLLKGVFSLCGFIGVSQAWYNLAHVVPEFNERTC